MRLPAPIRICPEAIQRATPANSKHILHSKECLRTCVMHAQLWSKARRLPRMGESAVGRSTTRQVSVRLHLGVQSVVAIGVDTPRIVASLCASTMTQQMDYSAVIAGLATSITLTRGPNMETWGRSNVRPDPWFFLFRTSFPHICTQGGYEVSPVFPDQGSNRTLSPPNMERSAGQGSWPQCLSGLAGRRARTVLCLIPV